jgi:hypothetical protein
VLVDDDGLETDVVGGGADGGFVDVFAGEDLDHGLDLAAGGDVEGLGEVLQALWAEPMIW